MGGERRANAGRLPRSLEHRHTGAMVGTRLVSTSAGAVEILHVPGDRSAVLFFPGGHCRAATDCGRSLYAGLGHEVVSFSRPGYGGTRVGRLTAAEFTPLVGRCVNSSGFHRSLPLWGFRSGDCRRCTSLLAAGRACSA